MLRIEVCRRRRGPGVQQAVELIDVGAWDQEATPASGAEHRKKVWLVSPGEPGFEFVRPAYQHLWKLGIRRAPDQFWNEILAFRLGHYLGISVPPTHVAFNSLTREVGALSEYFSYDKGRPGQFRPGSALLPAQPPLRDRRGESSYNFTAVSGWLSFLERNHLMLNDWREYWSQAFLLDSLMGNTDRHIDNWGAVVSSSSTGRELYRLAPLFDNGTSMGYEHSTERLKEILASNKLPSYVNRGTHQMFWRPEDTKRLSHPDLLRRFYDEFPMQRAGILGRLGISDRTIERVVTELTEFRSPIRLGVDRARCMIKLLKYRRDRLISYIEMREASGLLRAA